MQPTTPVSFDTEELILVTADDVEQGFATKAACHDGAGRLHRAFSLFILNHRGELLLQRRSQKKRLWGGYWSNSCCSHPRRGENLAGATARRLRQELGLSADLEFLFKFEYRARFFELGSEHELCHVFLGRADGEPVIHPDEISETRWVPVAEVADLLAREPEQHTPWFKLEWERIVREHAGVLRP